MFSSTVRILSPFVTLQILCNWFLPSNSTLNLHKQFKMLSSLSSSLCLLTGPQFKKKWITGSPVCTLIRIFRTHNTSSLPKLLQLKQEMRLCQWYVFICIYLIEYIGQYIKAPADLKAARVASWPFITRPGWNASRGNWRELLFWENV